MPILDKIRAYFFKRKWRYVRENIDTLTPSKFEKLLNTLNPQRMKLITRYRLRNALQYAAKKSHFYREVIRENIDQLDVKNVISFLRQLPFTTPADISQNPKNFLAVPESDITAIHFSAGTTGNQKRIYLNKFDLNRLIFSYSLSLLLRGLTSEDVAQIMYGFGIWQLGALFEDAFHHLGITCLPTGNHINFQEQQEFIEEFGTTVLVGTPTYVYNFALASELSPESKAKMKVIFLGGEGLSQKQRQTIEEKLGGEVFLGYGLMEFGGVGGAECAVHSGYHVSMHVYPEIVDVDTGEPVQNGEFGELVLTSLDRKAMPLIRYRTGDVTRFLPEECPCGLGLSRIDFIKGRTDDRITIGTAEKYYPKVFETLFDALPEVKDFQVLVSNASGRDTLKVNVITDAPNEELEQKILSKLYELTSLRIDIRQTKTVIEPEIMFTEELPYKTKRRPVVDAREPS